jgi:hypothetical protein
MFCVAFMHGLTPAFSQQFSVNTDELWPLVNEWNFAHQQKSIESLKRVYGDSVNYFGKTYSRESLLREKKKFFQSHPRFVQRIESAVNYVAYSTGVVKADFALELENGKESSGTNKAYLILSYEDNKYKIVGESDSLSDVENGFDLALGEPMQFGDSSGYSSDSSFMKTITNYKPNSILKTLSASLLFSEEVIEIPIRDIAIISTLLLITFISLIVSLAHSKRKSRNGKTLSTRSTNGHSKVEQQTFQRFVVTLFDPLYFSLITASHPNGHHFKGIDMEFEFRKQDVRAFVALKCLYLTGRINGSVKLFPTQSIDQFRKLAQSSGDTEFYLVVGIGGKPDDPAETYLLPSHEISSDSISYTQLQQYRKYGMFFYNSNAGELK